MSTSKDMPHTRILIRILAWIPVILYSTFILGVTIFSRSTGTERIVKALFWKVKNRMWHDIRMNILLFLPLGILLGACFRSWKAVLVGVLLSACIEIIQYVGMLGYCEADDMLNNTIGTALGLGLWKMSGRRLGNR